MPLNIQTVYKILLYLNIELYFYILVSSSFNTPTRLSEDNIYGALRTMDLRNFGENTYEYGIQSTPMKGQSSPSIPYGSPSIPYRSPSFPYGSPSIPYRSPSIPYRSPSIPYASPSWHRALQTPVHDRPTHGRV